MTRLQKAPRCVSLKDAVSRTCLSRPGAVPRHKLEQVKLQMASYYVARIFLMHHLRLTYLIYTRVMDDLVGEEDTLIRMGVARLVGHLHRTFHSPAVAISIRKLNLCHKESNNKNLGRIWHANYRLSVL